MERRKVSKRRIRKRQRILKFLLFVLIITLIYLFAFKTSFFNIKSIKVVGNKKMSYDQIVKASLCVEGENIFKISKKSGEESLKRLPYVKDSKIKRKLPKELVIEVEERKEIAVIPYIGSFAYIDEEGYILSIEKSDEEVELPQILGLELNNLEVGNNLFDALNKDNINEFIVISDQSKLLSLMKFINFSDNNNMIIELKNGIKVAFGPLGNVKYKLSFLNKILEDIEVKKINAKQILLNKGGNPIIVIDNN